MGAAHGSLKADQYVETVQAAIDDAIKNLDRVAAERANSTTDSTKGFLAEEWHAGTHNIDAARKGLTDHHAHTLQQQKPGDIQLETPQGSQTVESKYYQSGQNTSTELSHSKYDDMEKVGPSDQIEDAKAYAEKQAMRNADIRPEKSESYRTTHENVKDHIGNDAQSTPADHDSMKGMANDYKRGDGLDTDRFGLNTESYIEWKHVLEQSTEAAANAALLTAVLKAAPHVGKIVKDLYQDGYLNVAELKAAGRAAVNGSVEGGLRGGIAAAITTSCKSGLMGESFKNIDPTVIAAATVIAMNAVNNSFRLYRGEITNSEFAECCLRDTFIVSVGVWGATLGQGLIPIPVLGAVIGNFIGSTLATIVYEGSKEIFLGMFIESGKPFFSLVKQDYTMPRSVLERCGFNLIAVNKVDLDLMELDRIELNIIELDTIDIKVLKRGLISLNTIGYLE